MALYGSVPFLTAVHSTETGDKLLVAAGRKQGNQEGGARESMGETELCSWKTRDKIS